MNYYDPDNRRDHDHDDDDRFFNNAVLCALRILFICLCAMGTLALTVKCFQLLFR